MSEDCEKCGGVRVDPAKICWGAGPGFANLPIRFMCSCPKEPSDLHEVGEHVGAQIHKACEEKIKQQQDGISDLNKVLSPCGGALGMSEDDIEMGTLVHEIEKLIKERDELERQLQAAEKRLMENAAMRQNLNATLQNSMDTCVAVFFADTRAGEPVTRWIEVHDRSSDGAHSMQRLEVSTWEYMCEAAEQRNGADLQLLEMQPALLKLGRQLGEARALLKE